ncbi:MAG: hypothetical protein N2508_03465, partial [Anaerolineae bacterium]|nr:hypothetical protein [Anaerolineae bacterium]
SALHADTAAHVPATAVITNCPTPAADNSYTAPLTSSPAGERRGLSSNAYHHVSSSGMWGCGGYRSRHQS